MHTQTLHGHCTRTNRRGFFSALRLGRRKWWRNRRRTYVARRLALTEQQREQLDVLLSAFSQSRERTRENLAELFPQLDELLEQNTSRQAALAMILRGGLTSLNAEVDAIVVPASEFIDSLDAAQRESVREALRRRLS